MVSGVLGSGAGGKKRPRRAAVGAVLRGLRVQKRLQDLLPQAIKIHISAGLLLPALAACAKRQVKIIGVQHGAVQLLCQPVGQRSLAAAAAPVDAQQHGGVPGGCQRRLYNGRGSKGQRRHSSSARSVSATAFCR